MLKSEELEFIVAKAIAFNYLAGTGILLSPNFNQDGRIDFLGEINPPFTVLATRVSQKYGTLKKLLTSMHGQRFNARRLKLQ